MMEMDSDLERIWLGDKFAWQQVYPLYDLMLMGLWWQVSNSNVWDMESVIDWMKENPHRVGD